ncbi:MAG: hypothetical protein V8T86_00325 [Victivallis sp.]
MKEFPAVAHRLKLEIGVTPAGMAAEPGKTAGKDDKLRIGAAKRFARRLR